MQNPHEQQQEVLINRIASSVDRLNNVLQSINKEINHLHVNGQINDMSHISDVWSGYNQNLSLSLQSVPHRDHVDITRVQTEAIHVQQLRASLDAARQPVVVPPTPNHANVNGMRGRSRVRGGKSNSSTLYNDTSSSRMRSKSRTQLR